MSKPELQLGMEKTKIELIIGFKNVYYILQSKIKSQRRHVIQDDIQEVIEKRKTQFWDKKEMFAGNCWL